MVIEQKSHLKFKVIVTGDKAVGKTSLIRRFCTGEFKPDTKSTIGVDFMLKQVHLDTGEATLTLWDFAGEQKFRSLLPNYVSGASGALLLFDLTNPETFAKLPAWLEVLQGRGQDLVIILVGNKRDLVEDPAGTVTNPLDRPVSIDRPEGALQTPRALLERYNIPLYVETSAKDGTNVNSLFNTLGNMIVDHALAPCPHCNHLIPKQLLFCAYCGKKVVR